MSVPTVAVYIEDGHAHIACDADLRTSNPIWRGIASRLIVKAVSA
jgi:hypothetical protein